ncbi:MAG: cache domain-containing protein [Desulfuromonadales bacterium]|nr:cache domain-containing protein [Desulfuromonadales bacterium]
MSRYLFNWINNLKIRWKMMVVVLPLVVVPIFLLGGLIGYVATGQSYKGLIDASKADLDHMADFTLDLLDGHYRQYEVYREDKKQLIRDEMAALVNLAYGLVEEEQRQHQSGLHDLAAAQEAAGRALKGVNIGGSGYIYAMNSQGLLTVHLAREGENVANEQDQDGHFFIHDMLSKALVSDPRQVLFIVYPWSNASLGEGRPREKVVAYRYFPEWDWIIAAGGYLDETYEDFTFEQSSLNALKEQIKNKKVGKTGYIFCMTSEGLLTIHPDAEGENIFDSRDSDNRAFIAEMCDRKNGWIRYPWRNQGEGRARMKIVRYRYFEPWDWIVAVGSYEDEFYGPANRIKWRIITHILVLPLVIGLLAAVMVFFAAKVLTDPIHRMITVIRRVKQGRLDEQMPVESQDELGELATTFNRMTRMLRRNKEMETALAQQGKMASLGVLSSGVAHEINNPLGVILGYAGYLEKKIPESDPNFRYINEIKRESKRCKKIVQDLLSYARTPKPVLEQTDLNRLLGQIIEFATNHTDLHGVRILRNLDYRLPAIPADGDQLRQVAINLILNAGAAMPDGGLIEVNTSLDEEKWARIEFCDSGSGISDENLEKIFEPFFTTRARGTGLGLAITKQIIDQHQGEIFIDSVVGQGTTVVVRLPLKRTEYLQ